MAIDTRRRSDREQDLLTRLLAGEENPYLVYELCKQWRPGSFAALIDQLPHGVPGGVAYAGWCEYEDTRR